MVESFIKYLHISCGTLHVSTNHIRIQMGCISCIKCACLYNGGQIRRITIPVTVSANAVPFQNDKHYSVRNYIFKLF